MAITAYPKVGGSTNDAQFRDFANMFLGSGAWGEDDLRPYGDGSGLLVKLAPGIGAVEGCPVKSTAVESVPIDAGSGGGLSRRDAIVWNLDYTQEPMIQPGYLKGEPAAANPVLPSLAPAGNVVARWLAAEVLVSPTAVTINAADVVDRRAFLPTSMSRWATGNRPESPRLYELGFNTTVGRWEWWTGAEWKVFSSADISDATTIGRNILKAANAAAVRSLVGATPVGEAVLTAASVKAAREALRIFVGTTPGAPQVGDIRTRNA